jgi:hypothetical protein
MRVKAETISIANKIFRHYKGNNYKVLMVAKHTETNPLEKLVIYKEHKPKDKIVNIWARPYNMFMDKVEYDGQIVKRFTKIK